MAAPLLPLVDVSLVPLDAAGDDGVDDEGDADDGVELVVSSVLEHPAPAATNANAASSNTMEGIVFMAQAFNGPIALWQPQAYNDCLDVAEEIAVFVFLDEL